MELREEARGLVDLQIVAFPQQGILGFDGGADLMRRAVQLGADVVGGIPHYELTREDGVASVEFAFALAEEHGLRVDIHCDETDDEHSRFVEVMAAETIRRGMAGRVTASHTTAMHSYGGAYAYRLIRNIARSGMDMVVNPLDNSVLQGRFDPGPVRRGITRVKELQAAGVNVSIGHDSVMDPWYPLGHGDPMQAAFVLAHLGQHVRRRGAAPARRDGDDRARPGAGPARPGPGAGRPRRPRGARRAERGRRRPPGAPPAARPQGRPDRRPHGPGADLGRLGRHGGGCRLPATGRGAARHLGSTR